MRAYAHREGRHDGIAARRTRSEGHRNYGWKHWCVAILRFSVDRWRLVHQHDLSFQIGHKPFLAALSADPRLFDAAGRKTGIDSITILREFAGPNASADTISPGRISRQHRPI